MAKQFDYEVKTTIRLNMHSFKLLSSNLSLIYDIQSEIKDLVVPLIGRANFSLNSFM